MYAPITVGTEIKTLFVCYSGECCGKPLWETCLGKRRKFYARILSGQSDQNIPFERTRTLLKHLGFNERITGDHYIFEKPGVDPLIDLQPTRESKCKPYQVKQIRKVLIDYKIEL